MHHFMGTQLVRKTIIKIFKIIGIVIGAIISLIILVLLILWIMRYISDQKQKALVKDEDFLKLHNAILKLDKLKNIAILPNHSFIVVNGLIINNETHTYGLEPELGFYMNYYENGLQNKIISFDKLVSNANLDSTKTMNIINDMNKLEITDIEINHESDYIISYRKDVSATYGEKGIIYTKKEPQPRDEKEIIEPLENDFYFYKRK